MCEKFDSRLFINTLTQANKSCSIISSFKILKVTNILNKDFVETIGQQYFFNKKKQSNNIVNNSVFYIQL